MAESGPSTCLTGALGNMGGPSVAELLGPDAADRLGSGPADGPHVVTAQVDGDRVGGDMDGDDLPVRRPRSPGNSDEHLPAQDIPFCAATGDSPAGAELVHIGRERAP